MSYVVINHFHPTRLSKIKVFLGLSEKAVASSFSNKNVYQSIVMMPWQH
jgi:hypothetical protein